MSTTVHRLGEFIERCERTNADGKCREICPALVRRSGGRPAPTERGRAKQGRGGAGRSKTGPRRSGAGQNRAAAGRDGGEAWRFG